MVIYSSSFLNVFAGCKSWRFLELRNVGELLHNTAIARNTNLHKVHIEHFQRNG